MIEKPRANGASNDHVNERNEHSQGPVQCKCSCSSSVVLCALHIHYAKEQADPCLLDSSSFSLCYSLHKLQANIRIMSTNGESEETDHCVCRGHRRLQQNAPLDPRGCFSVPKFARVADSRLNHSCLYLMT